MPKSFKPVIDKHTSQMVIGSMPGAASLAAGEYYAYKHNAFWRIIFDSFSSGFDSTCPPAYTEKLQILLANNTGLWDTLAACQREGSLDSNIKAAIPNDFKGLLKKYPGVKKLVFNGQTAYKYFIKHFGFLPGIEYIVMPSTSPANAGTDYKAKLKLWRAALVRGNTQR